MFTKLKAHFKSKVSLTENELELIDKYFEVRDFKKKDFLLESGKACDFIGYIEKGTIRHFHIKDGEENTCDISFSGHWITDFQSFTNCCNSVMNLQVLEETTVFIIYKENLYKLYKECNKYETFGRLMAEQVAQRATEIAMSLSSDKPEERFQKLIKTQPELFQRISQKYIANLLGIKPESLSRIRKRILSNSKP
ncbi:Crp/Fnr family transcriptional regulator [Dysgonomonas macrotermitis]|uniref:cAMP-binding domain of CRP or a regulatory subunit of cAMP-dependent protein kinases n=1 Tax=Dysgonomonas macrotermitis TaxID=1346286 RepID=A0A1M5EHL4_9BACT|nr:Crp/Fnr family transcriptional regulator [Dysgonomonas macrotermitis]SHF78541.1 cAMP-binding domain of CRP or a regulatory subunit of cAMP-dependent protein kinases [Dysgonomonas macrotermitis]